MSKSLKQSSSEQKRKSPMVFGSQPYFNYLVDVKKKVFEALLEKDYDRWLTALATFYSDVSKWTNGENVYHELQKIRHNIARMRYSNASNRDQVKFQNIMRGMDIQKSLFEQTQDLFLKESTEDVEDFQIDDLMEETH